MKWMMATGVCSMLNQMFRWRSMRREWLITAKRILSDVGLIAGSKDEVKHVGKRDKWCSVMKMVWCEGHKLKSVCCDHEEAEHMWSQRYGGWVMTLHCTARVQHGDRQRLSTSAAAAAAASVFGRCVVIRNVCVHRFDPNEQKTRIKQSH